MKIGCTVKKESIFPFLPILTIFSFPCGNVDYVSGRNIHLGQFSAFAVKKKQARGEKKYVLWNFITELEQKKNDKRNTKVTPSLLTTRLSQFQRTNKSKSCLPQVEVV